MKIAQISSKLGIYSRMEILDLAFILDWDSYQWLQRLRRLPYS